MNNSQKPVARQDGLVIQEMPEEILVFDLKTNKAHCLNQTAALVWKSCDGKNSIPNIAQILELQSGDKVQEDLIWLAIDQLNENDLLVEGFAPAFKNQTRRQVIKKVGLAAVIALPLVSSLVAPTTASAVACSGTVTNCAGCNPGTPCTNNGTPGTCSGNSCVPNAPRGTKTQNGGAIKK